MRRLLKECARRKSALCVLSSTRCFSGVGPTELNFSPHEDVPGFFFSNSFVTATEHATLLGLFEQMGEGTPDPFGRGMFAGLQFPEDNPSFERDLRDALVELCGRAPFFSGNPAVGVVLLRYERGGSLAPHCDDPERYGDTVLTAGFGSPATLQMQRYDVDVDPPVRTHVERVLLSPGSAYAMTGPARREWLHGIEPGETIDMGNGQQMERSTRFALLMTEPMPNFSGAVLVRHGALRGGGRLFELVAGALQLRRGAMPLDRVLEFLDQGMFPAEELGEE